LSKVAGHYFEDIVEANAQSVFDTVAEIEDFIDSKLPGLDDVLDDLINPPEFWNDSPQFVDNALAPFKVLLSSDLPGWLSDSLSTKLRCVPPDIAPAIPNCRSRLGRYHNAPGCCASRQTPPGEQLHLLVRAWDEIVDADCQIPHRLLIP
jgi:hypothetical protein